VPGLTRLGSEPHIPAAGMPHTPLGGGCQSRPAGRSVCSIRALVSSPVSEKAKARSAPRCGQTENLIKLHKAQLASDRTSCRSPLANQMRLILHTAAYWLILTVREQLGQPVVSNGLPLTKIHQAARPPATSRRENKKALIQNEINGLPINSLKHIEQRPCNRGK
jgi:hypothetical protein